MKHYLGSNDGFKIAIEMGCNHPDMKNNSTDSVGCNSECSECADSIASTTIPEMMELLKRDNCTSRQ